MLAYLPAHCPAEALSDTPQGPGAVVKTTRAEILVDPCRLNAGRDERSALQVQHLAAVAFGDSHVADQHPGLVDTAKKAGSKITSLR